VGIQFNRIGTYIKNKINDKIEQKRIHDAKKRQEDQEYNDALALALKKEKFKQIPNEAKKIAKGQKTASTNTGLFGRLQNAADYNNKSLQDFSAGFSNQKGTNSIGYSPLDMDNFWGTPKKKASTKKTGCKCRK